MNIELIGYVAAAFGLLAFSPQAIKTWRTKETKGISLGTYVMFWFGVLLWLVYGILIGKPPVIIVNVVVLTLASIILFLKIRHG